MVESNGKRRNGAIARHRLAVCGALSAFVWTDPAWAYLDPGTGWMILQGILAAIAAAGVAVGTCWSTVRAWFSRRPKQDTDGLPARGRDK